MKKCYKILEGVDRIRETVGDEIFKANKYLIDEINLEGMTGKQIDAVCSGIEYFSLAVKIKYDKP